MARRRLWLIGWAAWAASCGTEDVRPLAVAASADSAVAVSDTAGALDAQPTTGNGGVEASQPTEIADVPAADQPEVPAAETALADVIGADAETAPPDSATAADGQTADAGPEIAPACPESCATALLGPCLVGVCSQGNLCVAQAKADGSPCDDGKACSHSDQCKAGQCAGVAYACDDKNPCTADSCDGKGCVFAASANLPCDDGNPCTSGDTCQNGTCAAGKDGCAALLPAGVGASPCHLNGDLPKASSIAVVPWFTKLAILQPIHLTYFPDGSDRMVAVSRPGTIRLFNNDPNVSDSKLVLDIAAKISTLGEGGLLSVAFHPQFKKTKKFYVNYTTTGVFTTIVSEFSMGADGETANAASEKILLSIKQPYTNHNGGQLFFDAEGFLLVGMGDGGAAGDPLNSGQDQMSMLGKMLRIDVDKAENGKNYAIPKNNPFVGNPAYLPEIFALGMRNPWRFSVDRATGAIWAGDVGQDKWEEVDVIEKGKNYGWRQLEGTHCYNPSTNCQTAGMTMPVAELPHGQANSITGGYVYRGSQNPALYGAYVFADYSTGKYWATTPDGLSGYATKELIDTADAPVTFGEDRDGELYVAQLYPAKIWKIVQQTTQPPAGAALPKKLSETNCFSSLAPLKPAAGVLPYEVNAPLWSDGASKQRFVVLPPGSAPKPNGSGPVAANADALQSWAFPVGTLLIKHFALGSQPTPVETRFLRRDAGGWAFFTFRWQADGKDADLWMGGGAQNYDVKLGNVAASQTWTMPSASQCGSCHRGPSEDSRVLGLQSAQLDRAAAWSQGQNQLAVWSAAGLLQKPLSPAAIAELPDLNSLDAGPPAGSLNAAARAYLHANCSHCHRPGGLAPTNMDWRFGTPLGQTNACNAAPQAGDLGVAGAAILKPKLAAQSLVSLRMSQPPASGWLMPPLAVQVPHAAGAKLVADWISGLADCAGP